MKLMQIPTIPTTLLPNWTVIGKAAAEDLVEFTEYDMKFEPHFAFIWLIACLIIVEFKVGVVEMKEV